MNETGTRQFIDEEKINKKLYLLLRYLEMKINLFNFGWRIVMAYTFNDYKNDIYLLNNGPQSFRYDADMRVKWY